MKSKLTAFAWEYKKTIHREISILFIAGFLLCSFIYIKIGEFAQPRVYDTILYWQLMATGLILVYKQCMANRNKVGFLKRLYTLPVSTKLIVFSQMLFTITTLALIRFLTSWSIKVLYHIPLDIIGHTLLLLIIILSIQSALWFWQDAKHILFLFLSGILWGGLIIMINAYPHHRISKLIPNFLQAGIIINLSILNLRAAHSNRHNIPEKNINPKRLFTILFHLHPTRTKTFKSPYSARLWYEWREKGLPIAIVYSIAALILLIIMIVLSTLYPEDTKSHLLVFFIVAYFLCIIGSALLGTFAGANTFTTLVPNKNKSVSRYPISSQAIANSLLKSGILIFSSCIAVTVIAAVCHFSWVLLMGKGDILFSFFKEIFQNSSIIEIAGILISILSIGWIILALSITLVCTDSLKLIYSSTLIVMLCLFSIPVILHKIKDNPAAIHFVQINIGTLLIIGIISTFLVAIYKKIIQKTTGLWSILLWMGVSISIFLLYKGDCSFPQIILFAGLSMLPLMPLALTPITVHFSRHK